MAKYAKKMMGPANAIPMIAPSMLCGRDLIWLIWKYPTELPNPHCEVPYVAFAQTA